MPSFNPNDYRNDMQGVNSSLQGWDQFYRDQAQGSINYAQNNPYQQYANQYIGQTLSGDMGNNPWMQALYGNTAGVNQNESFDMLRDFLGYGGGGGSKPTSGGGSRPSSGGGKRPTSTGGGGGFRPMGQGEDRGNAGGFHGSSSSSRRGGNIPDSTVGDKVFSREINEVLSDARLDPANDPTMAPMIEALQREAQESYDKSRQNLVAQIEGAGQFGSSAYVSMMGMANEEYNEAIQGTLAQQYQAARQAALQHQMEALNMVNQRDIASAQIAAQESAAAGAAAAQASAIKAQMDMHNQEMQLQGIGMMMQGAQFGMGMQGQMASLMQQGQQGALQAGLGFGQLGMSGYDAAANFGQLGLGANQQLMGNYNNYYSLLAQNDASQRAAQAQRDQLAFSQRRYNDMLPYQQAGSMIDIMRGLYDLTGYNQQPNYIPQPGGYNGPSSGAAGAMGAIGGGMQGYSFYDQMFG